MGPATAAATRAAPAGRAQVLRTLVREPRRAAGTPRAVTRGMDDPSTTPASTFLIALHVLMWTVLGCGLIALMVVVMITPTR